MPGRPPPRHASTRLRERADGGGTGGRIRGPSAEPGRHPADLDRLERGAAGAPPGAQERGRHGVAGRVSGGAGGGGTGGGGGGGGAGGRGPPPGAVSGGGGRP